MQGSVWDDLDEDATQLHRLKWEIVGMLHLQLSYLYLYCRYIFKRHSMVSLKHLLLENKKVLKNPQGPVEGQRACKALHQPDAGQREHGDK